MNRREVKRAPVLRFKGFTNDWEQRKLKKLGFFYKGKGYTKKDLINNGVPILLYGELYTHYSEKISNTRLHSKLLLHSIFSAGNEVVLPDSGETSTDIARASWISNSGIILAGGLIIIKPNEYIFPGFLAYSLTYGKNHKLLASRAQGKSIVHIHANDLKTLNIIYPENLKEQQRIFALLEKLNKCIALQQRKLKLLKEIRKGIVENIRDNNFEYKEQKNDFKDVKIKDMFKITRGKVLPKEKISSNKISPNIYPVFSSQTLNNGLLGFYKDYLFQNAITWTTDGANAGTVNFRNEKFYSTNVNGVLLQKKIKPDLLTADLLNLVAFKYVSKVGNPKLMNNTMANIRIKIPSNTNARIFYSKILNKCDTKIDFINKKIDYLTTFKRFLLQNMFI